MNSRSLFNPVRAAALCLCLALGVAHVGWAQSSSADDPDPPDRAARLSFIQGEVSLQPAGEEEWASAIVNRPLTTGDRLWTDEGARAEIYVGPAAVRLGSDTGFSFLNVDDNTIQMRMTAGVMDVRVRSLDADDQIEIDTPNLALSLLRPGRYRVEVNDEGDTTVVKVLEGEAEASGGTQDTVVHAQQSARFVGTEKLAANFGSLGVPDEFDSWTLERDRRDQQAMNAPAAKYVSPEVTGYEDLDANGSWSSEPEYGYVWTPRVVAVDWSPYRYGRWVWVAPWGWTWVDDAPWGYAPFHYGRWAHVRERWCWVPGPRHVRPVYAPALVGWVGSPGVNVSVSVGGGGGVAWFPLGPREVYVPARRYSPRYVERVNVSNTVIVNKTYITNVYTNRNVTYRNRGVPGGVTAVTRTTFTSAERVGHHMVRVDEREITRVRSTGAAPQIQPVRQSRLGSSEAQRGNWRPPPQAIVNRQVIVKRAPPQTGAHLVRNSGPSVRGEGRADDPAAAQRDAQSAAREQSDRVNRLKDRNEAIGRNRPNGNNDVSAQTEAARAAADARRNANGSGLQSGDARDAARAAADARRDANRDGGPSADANDAARAAADARRNERFRDGAPVNAQDERPAQSRVRPDRPQRAGGSAIPDHVNRGSSNDNSATADRLQAERHSRIEQTQQESQRRQEESQRRLEQAQENNQRIQERTQHDQQRTQEDNQRRLEQAQQNSQRLQERTQQDQQRRQEESTRRQEQAQINNQRLQERAQQEQQRRQEQTQQDQQRRQEQAQQQQQRQQQQAEQQRASSERARPEPQRQAEQRPAQERERRRPQQSNREN